MSERKILIEVTREELDNIDKKSTFSIKNISTEKLIDEIISRTENKQISKGRAFDTFQVTETLQGNICLKNMMFRWTMSKQLSKSDL